VTLTRNTINSDLAISDKELLQTASSDRDFVGLL
jgi:hypothetical protein